MRRVTENKTSATRRGTPRPRVKPLWRRPVVVASGAALGVVAIAAGVWWVWQNGIVQRSAERAKWAVIAVSAKSGFAVQEIFVQGRQRTSVDALRKALRLERGTPILAFDPDVIQSRIEALPWIRTATIERQLPDVVHLQLVERQPMAIWQHDGTFSLIDTAGAVIDIDRLDSYRQLIVIVGSDAPENAAGLFTVLAQLPDLARRVTAAVRVGSRRWNLHFEGGITVRLPEEDPAGAWHRLADLDQTYGLLARSVSAVDLRYPDRVIVRPGPGQQTPSARRHTET